MFKERSEVLGQVGIEQVCELKAQVLVKRATKNGVRLIFYFMGCTNKAGAFVAGCFDLWGKERFLFFFGKVTFGMDTQTVLVGAES